MSPDVIKDTEKITCLRICTARPRNLCEIQNQSFSGILAFYILDKMRLPKASLYGFQNIGLSFKGHIYIKKNLMVAPWETLAIKASLNARVVKILLLLSLNSFLDIYLFVYLFVFLVENFTISFPPCNKNTSFLISPTR